MDVPLRQRVMSHYWHTWKTTIYWLSKIHSKGFCSYNLRRYTFKTILGLLTVWKNLTFWRNRVLSSSRFWSSIWDPLGLLLGGLLDPKIIETCLEISLRPAKRGSSEFLLAETCLGFFSRAAKSHQEHFFSALEAFQSAPRGLLEAFWGTSGFMKPFSSQMNDFWAPQGGPVSYTHLTLPTNREV